MSTLTSMPAQKLSYTAKNKTWRKQVVDWADSRNYQNYSPVRNSIRHKRINYDLFNGKLHMDDVESIVNPEGIDAGYIPDSIQHYPIINSKIQLLRGEELARVFDYKAVVTNPNAVSDIEKKKQEEILSRLQEEIKNSAQSEEEFNKKIDEISDYYTYRWQDFREIRANALLTHYNAEYDFKTLFNTGFLDAMIVSEEIYQTDIIGGEPTITKLDPEKVRVFRSGYSNKIEDADIVVIEDYWSPGRIIDCFYDSLSEKDMKYIANMPFEEGGTRKDSMDNIDERAGFIDGFLSGDEYVSQEGFFWSPDDPYNNVYSGMPYDMAGNIKVLRVYWKSWRKIKKVKSYDKETGEEVFTFYPETYVANKAMGEEESIYWINEAWEGTKIGDKLYVNMRPRVVQYNRLSNPSRCHFGIIGSIYNVGGQKPFSLVDMMNPYAYYYDVIHDRLNKLIAKNWGKIITLDLAKVPAGWDIDKWMYYAKTNSIAVVDSFKEGNIGNATGKLAGLMNNASSGVIDAELGNTIQFHLSLLEFIKGEMSEIVGVTRQREGQVSNRETVGGVERATLQGSHITEYLFNMHDNVKKRVLEAFLETAKIALKGKSLKFQYILPDFSKKMIEIDGDEFAECDYGIAVENNSDLQNLNQKIDMLAQAAMQNGYRLSVITKMYTSTSMMEKVRILEDAENDQLEQQQRAEQEKAKQEQQLLEIQQQTEKRKMDFEAEQNRLDNETKILVAEINAKAEADRYAIINDDKDGVQEMSAFERAKFKESQREFDAKLKLERDKLALQKKVANKKPTK
jgi:hypothetical protein